MFDFFIVELVNRDIYVLVRVLIVMVSVNANVEIVIDDRYLVLSEHDVKLDHLGATLMRLAERIDRILHKTLPKKQSTIKNDIYS